MTRLLLAAYLVASLACAWASWGEEYPPMTPQHAMIKIGDLRVRDRPELSIQCWPMTGYVAVAGVDPDWPDLGQRTPMVTPTAGGSAGR